MFFLAWHPGWKEADTSNVKSFFFYCVLNIFDLYFVHASFPGQDWLIYTRSLFLLRQIDPRTR